MQERSEIVDTSAEAPIGAIIQQSEAEFQNTLRALDDVNVQSEESSFGTVYRTVPSDKARAKAKNRRKMQKASRKANRKANK